MFKLVDIRKTHVWQEAYKESYREGLLLARWRVVQRLQAKGKSLKEIGELLDISVTEVRRLAKA